MNDDDARPPFTVGIFTTGDLIALASVIFMSGALWFRVGTLERDATHHVAQSQTEYDRLTGRVQALEQVIPSNYVRRDEYREDVREIKSLLQQLTVDIKQKADK